MASRLPIPGQDAGTWGQILNDFLSQSHQTDGSLKADAVTVDAITDNTVSQAKLDVGTGMMGQVLSTDGTNLVWTTVSGSGSVPDATSSIKGIVRLAGDLGGNAASPTVPGLATKADANATATALNGKEPTVTTGTTTQYYRGDKSWQTLDKATIGLGNVDNTSDANKPVSTAVQSALAAKANASSLATVATSGAYADLTGKPSIPAAQVNSDWAAASGAAQILNKPTIPAQLNATAGSNVTITGTYPNLTFAATPGAGVTDISITRDGSTVTVNSNTGADGTIAAADGTNAGILTSADKLKLDGVQAGAQVNTVTSVAGKTGVVALVKADVGLANVDNTSDANKPVSTAVAAALSQQMGSFSTLQSRTTSFAASGNAKYAVDSSGGVVTVTLPSTTVRGDVIMIQKSDVSMNAVAVTGMINGATGATITINLPLQGKLFQNDGTGNWFTLATELSLTSLDGRYVDLTSNQTVAGTKTFSTKIVADNGIKIGTSSAAGNVWVATDSVGNGIWATPDKSSLGLGNVDNTSDATKNAATATLTNKTLNTPKIDTVLDTNGANILRFGAQTNSVNNLVIKNREAGSPPTIEAEGADTDVSIGLIPKANGHVTVWRTTGNARLHGDGGDTNVNLDLTNKGTGRLLNNGVAVPTISSTDTLTNKSISGASNTFTSIPQSAVTNLTSDLAAKAGALSVATVVTATTYAAVAGQFIPVNTTSNSSTVTLPTAPAEGSRITVKHVVQGSTNTVTVACGGSDVFNKTGGSTSVALSLVNQAVSLQYNAANAIWYVISDDLPLSVLDARYQLSSSAGNTLKVYNAYADAPALPANTVVVSISGT